MKHLSNTQRATVTLVGLSMALVPVLSACSGSTSSDSSPSASTAVSGATESTSPTSATGGKPVLASGTAPAARTIAVSKAGFAPTSLTIAKGQNVTFKADGSGTYAVEVGGLDSATVTGGLIETFDFPEAGVYDVKEVITENTAQITVE